MNIPAALWSEVSALFDDAMALAGAHRGPWLVCLQESRPDVAIHVRRLIEAHERPIGDDPLSGPPSELVAAALAGQEARLQSLAAGLMLGPYRLLEPLGEGGMASVWLAEQTLNVVRRVALKIPHVGLEDPVATAARFAHERDLLAGLEHPQIARLYDAGVAEDGRPYLAMEWIDGLAITRYADEHRLAIAQRIDLFLQVLRAVRHAHARLVIHRDLKPSNIIVTPDGQVKLLDFGIARLLDDGFARDADASLWPGRALTPEAASPEQLAGDPLATSSDVYSLGVVLYELLTGQRPYRLHIDPAARSTAALHAALIATPVTVPSLLEIDAASAAMRCSTPRKLRSALTGDLDAIVGKTLLKQAAERYDSAEALAADLERHLQFEPVQAVHGGWSYIVGRAIRRHRAWATATVIVLLAIAVGVGGVAWQDRVARQEAARATAVKDFLLQVFKASDPRVASDKPRGQVSARELLDASSVRIERDFKLQPALQLELLGTVSRLYRELGEFDHYLALQDRRVALARQFPGRYPEVAIEAQLNRADDELVEPDYAKARAHLEIADRLIHDAGLDASLFRARWWLEVGQATEPTKFAAKQAAFDNSLQLYELHGHADSGRVTALTERGTLLYQVGDNAGAVHAFRRALEANANVVDRDDGDISTTWGNLGNAYMNLGAYDESEAALKKAADLALQTYGESTSFYWPSAAIYARLLHLNGHRDEATARFEALRKVMPYPPTGRDGWSALGSYAECLAAQGEPARALAWEEGIVRAARVHLDSPNSLRRGLLILGGIYEQLGRIEDARRTLKEAFDGYVQSEAPDRQTRMSATERWARFLIDQHQAAQAKPLFAEVLAHDRDRHLAHAALAQAGMARVALVEGDVRTAEEASAAAVKRWSEVRGFRDVRMGVYITRVRGETLLAKGDISGASAAARAAIADSQRYDAPHATSITEAEDLLRRSSAGVAKY